MTEKTHAELEAEIKELRALLDKQNTEAKDPYPGRFTTYAVRSGDSLWRIAQLFYGKDHGGDWPRIYEANKAVIGDDPDIIYPGQKFVIPPMQD